MTTAYQTHSVVYDTSILGAIVREADSDAEVLVAFLDEVKRKTQRRENGKPLSISELLSRARHHLEDQGVTDQTPKGVWKMLEPEMRAIADAARKTAARLPEGLTKSLMASPFFVYFATWMLHGALQARQYVHVNMVLRRGGKLSEEQLDQIAALLWRRHRARGAVRSRAEVA